MDSLGTRGPAAWRRCQTATTLDAHAAKLRPIDLIADRIGRGAWILEPEPWDLNPQGGSEKPSRRRHEHDEICLKYFRTIFIPPELPLELIAALCMTTRHVAVGAALWLHHQGSTRA